MATRGSQIFVKDLEGRWHCLQFLSSSVSGSEVKERLESCLGVPAGVQRLVTGTREVEDETLLVAHDGLCDDEDDDEELGYGGYGGGSGGGGCGPVLLPSCTLLLRLLGGKGGFGSLLRGAATKAGQKKTTNFDACRDMSGRRLRHVNAEKKLKEWQRDGKQRELEKAALQFLRKTERERTVEAGRNLDLAKLREESAEARDMVVDAVASGLEATKEKKRRQRMENDAKEQAGEASRKRIRMLEMLEAVNESDEEDSECEEHEDRRDGAGTSGSASSADDGSGYDSSPRGPLGDGPFASSPAQSTDGSQGELQGEGGVSSSQRSPSAAESGGIESVADGCAGIAIVDDACDGGNSHLAGEDVRSTRLPPPPSDNASPLTENRRVNSTVSAGGESLCLGNFNTAKDLEVLGLDGLKAELQKRGLKCGGSLEERAARLFLLKSTPLDKLDKKHFVKPSAKKG
ncbi:hypothetical protein CBR_g29554 [Chara braunii]|uniref:Uncharacterized protein n=1 Tax=Chara braunii TaxID=69332 RepID=A0A388LAQ9_CHABU|nr:hypothetical protein CBR_g29554 [Chara braunii]|eukprot:GBG79407.1 hypothetical protein CBR_g29554 [Chara braunii]